MVSIERSKHDDSARAFFGGSAQRKIGAARQLAARRGMTRRLRKAGMRAHPHHIIDPMWTRDEIEATARIIVSASTSVAAVSSNRKFVAGDAAAHRVGRQHLLQPLCDRHDEFIAAQHTVVCGNIIHAVEFDQRKGRALVVGSLCKREIQELQDLGVVRQPGELVFVGGAARPASPAPPIRAARRLSCQSDSAQNRPARRRSPRRTAPGGSSPASWDGLCPT